MIKRSWSENPYTALLCYMQLINAFGWEAFKLIFREYESLSDKDKIFTNDLDKWTAWICKFSNIVGLDVSPLFTFWAIPFSEKPGTNLNELKPFLPDDEITRIFENRVEYVKTKYSTPLLIGNEDKYTTCPKINYPKDFFFDSIEKLETLKDFNEK
jgi:hypothetical protein